MFSIVLILVHLRRDGAKVLTGMSIYDVTEVLSRIFSSLSSEFWRKCLWGDWCQPMRGIFLPSCWGATKARGWLDHTGSGSQWHPAIWNWFGRSCGPVFNIQVQTVFLGWDLPLLRPHQSSSDCNLPGPPVQVRQVVNNHFYSNVPCLKHIQVHALRSLPYFDSISGLCTLGLHCLGQ